MKAAFIFAEKYPNFDQAFHTIDRISDDEFRAMDSYVWTGVWNLYTAAQFGTSERRKAAVLSLLQGHENSLVAISSEDSPSRFMKEQIYVVQFNSIRKSLLLALNERLNARSDYLGVMEIHPDYPVHRIVFSGYGPLLKIEKGRLLLLYTGRENEEFAQEKLEWLKTHYARLAWKSEVFDSDLRFSVFDCRTWPAREFDVQRTTRFLNQEWEVTCEHVLYKLFDVAPDAADELKSAVVKLKEPNLDAADCAHLAVSFRRCLEKVADVLSPAKSNNQKDKYKPRLVDYVKDRLSATSSYADYVEGELIEMGTRIEKLYNMGNKGIHEDWFREALSTVALRLIVLLNDLLIPVAPAKAITLLEADFFDNISGKRKSSPTSP